MTLLPDNILENVLPFFSTGLGKAVFVPLYAVWVTLLLPGVWASMLAGAIYGTWLGSFLVFIGASIGAEVVFLLGRTLLRDWVNKRISKFPKLEAIAQSVSGEGLKLVLLTRLSPAFPFSFLNLVYGVSNVSLRDYTVGLIGILPGTILFCGLGSLAGNLANFGNVLSAKQDLNSYLLRIVGLLATLGVVWIVSRSIKSSLQK